jgi:hypothetical protein
VASVRASAEDSIAAARQRMAARERERESTAEAAERLRREDGASLAAAQARLRAADAASLGRLRGVMARYRRGEYVPEAELEAAFRALDDVPL